MDERIEVTLHSPAKVDLRTLLPGNHLVSAADMELLKEAGVVVSVIQLTEEPPIVPATLAIDVNAPAFEAAVEAEVQKRIGKAFDGALGKLEAEAKDLMKAFDAQEVEKDAAVNRAVLAEAKQAELQGLITGLEVALAAATAPPATNTATTTAPVKKPKAI